jgi:hypothetical protein
MPKFKLTRLCFCILLVLLCAAPVAAVAPTISSVSPTSATAGGPTFTLTVTGTNYAPGSVVEWVTSSGTVGLTTTYNSPTQLTATVTASLIASAGTVNIQVYVPGSRLVGGKSGLWPFTINAGNPTTTSLSSSSNPSTYGNPVTFTATVSPSTATGTVTFIDGSNAIGTGTLSSGTATYAISSLSVGSNSITASYGGDSNDAASTSSTLTQTVSQDTSSTSVASNLNPSSFGSPVTFTATVTPSTATGTVTFYDLGGTVALGNPVTLNSGMATLTIATLPPGAHSITAAYNGDANDTTSTSGVLAQTVSRLSMGLPGYCVY